MISYASRETEKCKRPLPPSELKYRVSIQLICAWVRFVWINEASNGEDPTFSNLGSVRTLSQVLLQVGTQLTSRQYKKPEMGLGQEHVRLGDIDGDGRLDYCVIKSDGYIQ